MSKKDFGQVEKLSLTVLVENKADLIVESTDQVIYFTGKPLLAEHGFSVLIRINDSENGILWDAGISKIALMENLKLMELEHTPISIIALSHGHSDHYGGMTDLITWLNLLPESKEWAPGVTKDEIVDWQQDSRIPLIAHPAAFRERWWNRRS